jgi:divalent metal cation (Fe/Co/Zn/Cd) transporter
VLIESVRDLVLRTEPDESVPGIVLAGVSLVVMPILARAKRKTGRAMGSATLVADAAETMLCALLSLILLMDCSSTRASGGGGPIPLAAVGIAALAFREGLEAWNAGEA